MTKSGLEKRYGVSIVWDYWCDEYKIYSADGCKWENGLPTIKACEKECREWADALIAIKNNCKEVTV